MGYETQASMSKLRLLIIIVCCCVTTGDACSCRRRHRNAAYCRENIVFLGAAIEEEVVEENVTEPGDESQFLEPCDFVSCSFGYRLYTVRIDTIFWATQSFIGQRTITLRTPLADGLCGIQFRLYRSYVFVASLENGEFTTYLCSGIKSWDTLRKRRKQFFTNDLQKLCARRT